MVYSVLWRHEFEGLTLTQESHAWKAGATFVERASEFNIMQACIRRPVRAQLATSVGYQRRLGRVVLTPAQVAMPVEATGEEAAFPVRKFELDAKWFGRLASQGATFSFNSTEAQPVFDDPAIVATLDRIYAEARAPGQDSAHLLSSLLQVLAIDTARLLQARQRSQRKARSLTAQQLAQIHLVIETTDFAYLSPAWVAKECGMGLPRLRDAFLHATGRTLRREIENARTHAACRALLETPHPLKVIAHQLGFAHASAFCYWFKSALGCTPSEYRADRHAIANGAAVAATRHLPNLS